MKEEHIYELGIALFFTWILFMNVAWTKSTCVLASKNNSKLYMLYDVYIAYM
jgi:hypothetical protein